MNESEPKLNQPEVVLEVNLNLSVFPDSKRVLSTVALFANCMHMLEVDAMGFASDAEYDKFIKQCGNAGIVKP